MRGYFGSALTFVAVMSLCLHVLAAREEVSEKCYKSTHHCVDVQHLQGCDLSRFKECLRANCTEEEYKTLSDLLCENLDIKISHRFRGLPKKLSQKCAARFPTKGSCMEDYLQHFELFRPEADQLCDSVKGNQTKACLLSSGQGCTESEYKDIVADFCKDASGAACGRHASFFLICVAFVLGSVLRASE